jgi:hypothetical protein
VLKKLQAKIEKRKSKLTKPIPSQPSLYDVSYMLSSVIKKEEEERNVRKWQIGDNLQKRKRKKKENARPDYKSI